MAKPNPRLRSLKCPAFCGQWRKAGAVADAEQVLITAAVGADVPDFPAAQRFQVEAGVVHQEA